VNCFNSILDHSLDFDVGDERSRIIDHFAAAGGSMEIIRALERLGHTFDAVDSSGWAPVHYALKMGHTGLVHWLWSKGIAPLEDGLAFSVACLMGHLDIVRFIFDLREEGPRDFLGKLEAEDSLLPIHFACRGGHSEVVSYLISQGSPIHCPDPEGLTPLQICARDGSLSCVKVLVESGALAVHSHSALLTAASSGHLDIVDFLIRHKSDPKESDSEGVTPLIGASSNRRLRVSQYLIEHGGISPESLNLLMRTASASRLSGLVPLIVDHLPESARLGDYAGPMMKQAMEVEDCELVDFLLDKGIAFDDEGANRAFQRKHGPFLDFLIERCGESAASFLMKAVQFGDVDRATRLMNSGVRLTPELVNGDPDCLLNSVRRHDEKALDLLLSCHPDLSKEWNLVSIAVDLICSPLHEPNVSDDVRESATRILERLLDAGAPIQRPGDPGSCTSPDAEDPIQLAVCYGNLALLRLFDRYPVDWSKAKYVYRFADYRNPDIPAAITFVAERGAKAGDWPPIERALTDAIMKGGSNDLFDFLLARATDADVATPWSPDFGSRGAVGTAMVEGRYDCAGKLLDRGFKPRSGAGIFWTWAVANRDPTGMAVADRLVRLLANETA
jgi:ankyrin repeat protein